MVVWKWGQCGGGGLEGSHVRDESRGVWRVDGGANGETVAGRETSLSQHLKSRQLPKLAQPTLQSSCLLRTNLFALLLFMVMRMIRAKCLTVDISSQDDLVGMARPSTTHDEPNAHHTATPPPHT
jgi:hypothetical protein